MFDHEAEYEDYLRIMREKNTKRKAERDMADSTCLALIEEAMKTPTRELHRLAPKPRPIISPSEIDAGIKAMEFDAFMNSSSAAERRLILERGRTVKNG